METLIQLGVDRVLTSGQQPVAIKGAALLADLVKQADGRIVIMPGCGVNESNIAELARLTGASEFHFSARENKESQMKLRILPCRWEVLIWMIYASGNNCQACTQYHTGFEVFALRLSEKPRF